MPNRLSETIDHAVEDRRADLVTLTQELIRIESITGNEGDIQAYIEARLRELDLEVDVWVPDPRDMARHPAFVEAEDMRGGGHPNVVGIWRGAGGGRSLILNGHVDTIPIDPVDSWIHGPFSGFAGDDRVHGRGASDMKSGLATMTMAVQVLADLGLKPQGDVILQYVVEEETTGYGTIATLQRGYTAAAGICLETSDLCVQPACVGRVWFTIRVDGQGLGLTRHWAGVNPIDKGFKIVQAIKDLEQMRWNDLCHPLYPDNREALPCGVFMFHSGAYPSAPPDVAELSGSLGTMPYEDRRDVERQIIDQVMQVAATDPWLRNHPPVVSFRKTRGYGAEIPPNHPIVRTMADSYAEIVGGPPTISGRTGGADTAYLIRHGGIPCVIFGPGETPQMHAMNETVPITNLVTATKVVALTIAEWCGVV
jgi:acetylornithine deacetylase